jgi:tetratricopeptide (TPR) repeat protein
MLLRLWACFDKRDIWFELLQHANSEDPEWIRKLTEDELNFNEAVGVLNEHGLVELDTSPLGSIGSRGYSLHGWVHTWSILLLNKEWDCDLVKLALKLVVSHIPKQDATKSWLTQRRLLRHALRCSRIVSSEMVPDDDMKWAFGTLGSLFRHHLKLDEAEKMYQRALQGYEKALGLDNTLTLKAVNNLGILYNDQGKLDEAERMLQRALQGFEKVLGPDHMSTLHPVNDLGNLYYYQGKLDEAEKMYQRALQEYEKALGPDHTLTLKAFNNLGNLYSHQGKLDEAERMLQRAWQSHEKALGPDNTFIGNMVDSWGFFYANLGRLDEDENMYQRALQRYENAVGLETVRRYPPALNTMMSLGNLFVTQGHPEKAKEMYSRVYKSFHDTLGPSSYQCQELTRIIASVDSTTQGKLRNISLLVSSLRIS